MRILFFSPYFYPYLSGITTYPFTLFTATPLGKKHGITVLTFPHQSQLPRNEKFKNISIIRLPYLFKISKGFISPQSLYYFWKETQNIDLVILNIPSFEGIFLAIIAKLRGKKILSIFHCTVTLPPGILNRFINVFLNSAVYLQLFLSNIIVGYTDDYVQNTLVGRLFKNKVRTHFPPVLPLNNFIHKSSIINHKSSFLVGYAGRVAREKGLEYLIEAVTQLKSRHNIKLLFAGPYGTDVAGEETYYQEIKDLLKKNDIQHTFLGKLSGKEFAEFYQSLSVLVLPSVNRTEAFGMVQVDAMLLGTPVVASNLPGVRVPVQTTKMGRIVEPKNSAQLAEAILEVIQDRDTYTTPQLTTHAQKIFDINKVYKFYKKILEMLRK